MEDDIEKVAASENNKRCVCPVKDMCLFSKEDLKSIYWFFKKMWVVIDEELPYDLLLLFI